MSPAERRALARLLAELDEPSPGEQDPPDLYSMTPRLVVSGAWSCSSRRPPA